jgi:hypothetical protein
MSAKPSERIKLQRALGSTRPPEKITQEAFDRDDKHLRRLVRLLPDERADARDLFDYMEDLRYTDIQGPLLVYLLPFCLEAWREDLQATHSDYGGMVEHLYPVLADRHIFDLHLKPEQTAVVSEFMRQAILQEIDDQRGLAFQGQRARPYRWFGALTTYGVLLPDMEHLWNEWWLLNTVGRAIAAVQYVSCLMYSETENPIFAPWTPNGGGGPPSLWEFQGHLYEHRWLEPNINFLRRVLTAQKASEGLSLAVERLVGQPEHAIAAAVLDDLPLCSATLEARCDQLPQLLETVQLSTTTLQWSV